MPTSKMLSHALATLLFLASAHALPQASDAASTTTTAPAGFASPVYGSSAGGKASCVSGLIAVPVNTTAKVISLASNIDQYNITQFFVNVTTVNSTTTADVVTGTRPLAATYSIYGQLCYPSGQTYSAKPLQLLTHGVNFDRSYWNLAPGLSYVDAAAAKGYATFLYDRLGVGLSARPDPIQAVQSEVELAVLHALTVALRAGRIGYQAWPKVVGVGHSFGSILTIGSTVQYPRDFDAAVLQGFSLSTANFPGTFGAFNPSIAANAAPARFAGLPPGYLLVNTTIGDQFAFLHYPGFQPSVFQAADAKRQTFTLGEIVTLGDVIAPATAFTGPVDVVLGVYDYIFCQGNCNYPYDQAAAVRGALYPASSAGSQSYLVPRAGHGINVQDSAPLAYSQMLSFLASNGL